MARKVDITDKLSFEENPSLVIKGKTLEVNADAPTMLKVMGLMSADNPGAQEILDAYDLMFPEKSKKEMEKMKLGFGLDYCGSGSGPAYFRCGGTCRGRAVTRTTICLRTGT